MMNNMKKIAILTFLFLVFLLAGQNVYSQKYTMEDLCPNPLDCTMRGPTLLPIEEIYKIASFAIMISLIFILLFSFLIYFLANNNKDKEKIRNLCLKYKKTAFVGIISSIIFFVLLIFLIKFNEYIKFSDIFSQGEYYRSLVEWEFYIISVLGVCFSIFFVISFIYFLIKLSRKSLDV